MSQEIIDAVRDIEREKGIESGTLVAALEDALLAAYKKMPGSARHATVEIDDQGDFRVFSVELPPDIEERLIEEARERKFEELEALEVETGERSHTLVSDDDLDVDWSDVPDEQIKRADVTPENFGRIAAQTAKQVILQRIREAERAMMYDEYVDRVTEVVTGIVQQAGDRNNVLVDLGKVEALLPRSEQVDGERYEQGSRIKAVITEVRTGTKGPQVILSRRDPELIKTLFELEVPEIADGLDEGREATVVVPDDQLALAIGKEGMNARLAHRLTGWKIDIVSDTEFAQQEAEAAFAGEEGEDGDVSGRCAAILSNGKRCPNASLPGSRYCGVPAHQELALHEPDDEADGIVEESEPGLEALADLAPSEAVTEDAAEFGNPDLEAEEEDFPAGPGDAAVPGEDETTRTGSLHEWAEDDPDGGVPIEHVARREEGESGGE